MKNNLEGAKALVTGINSHIGCAIGKELADRGTSIVGTYQPYHLHTGIGLGGIREQINASQLKGVIPLDLKDPASIAKAISAAEDSLNGLDVLVTVDSPYSLESYLMMPDAELLTRVRANLIGNMLLIRWIAHDMIVLAKEEGDVKRHRAIGIVGNVQEGISGPYAISTMKIGSGTVIVPIECQSLAREEDVARTMCDLLNAPES